MHIVAYVLLYYRCHMHNLHAHLRSRLLLQQLHVRITTLNAGNSKVIIRTHTQTHTHTNTHLHTHTHTSTHIQWRIQGGGIRPWPPHRSWQWSLPPLGGRNGN